MAVLALHLPVQPWHRDLFRHFTSSRPIGLTCIWVLDEFNETNDGITILPSTQKHDVFPSYEYVEKYQKKIFSADNTLDYFKNHWFFLKKYGL